jgi:hypothetical protein
MATSEIEQPVDAIRYGRAVDVVHGFPPSTGPNARIAPHLFTTISQRDGLKSQAT